MSHSLLAATIVFYAGPVPVTETVITTWALMAALAIGCGLATRRLTVIPTGLQAMVETLVEGIAGQIRSIIDRDPWHFMPVLATLFIFLVTANLSGLLPGVRAPTASIETPAALATVVFFSVHVYGVWLNGPARLPQGLSQTKPCNAAAQRIVGVHAVVFPDDAPVRQYYERRAGIGNHRGVGGAFRTDPVHAFRNPGGFDSGLHLLRAGCGLHRRGSRDDGKIVIGGLPKDDHTDSRASLALRSS